MLTRRRSWWQNIPKPLLMVGVVVLLVGVVALIYGVYQLKWDWTGFNEHIGPNRQQYQPARTLWDWLQLLIIPAVLAIGALWFNAQQRKVSDAESTDNQQETALQDYIDKMSEFLLKKSEFLLKEQLHESQSEEDKSKERYQVPQEYEVEKDIARVRTLTVLRKLDSVRKGSVLQFLHESSLITIQKPDIDLSGVDLSRVDLSVADLSDVDLSVPDMSDASGVNLSDVDLSGANLTQANLALANLARAKLTKAILIDADLRGVHLNSTNLKWAYLNDAKLCAITQDIDGVSKKRDQKLWDALHSAANLSEADLSEAHLHEADLTNAKLIKAILSGADLTGANLKGANLTDADLSGADLTGANLKGATGTTKEQLEQAKSLKGATRPDGSKHP